MGEDRAYYQPATGWLHGHVRLTEEEYYSEFGPDIQQKYGNFL